MLQQEFSANRQSVISNRSSRLDSLNDHDKFSLLMREHKVINNIAEVFGNCSLEQLIPMLSTICLITSFSRYNDRDFERAQGYQIIHEKLLDFKTDELPDNIDAVFNCLK